MGTDGVKGEDIIMRVIQKLEMRRGWTLRLAALTALLGLAAAFAPSLSAQGLPDPPHWFYGIGYDNYSGTVIRAVDSNGATIDSTTVNTQGQWSITIATEHRKVRFEFDADDGTRTTVEYDVQKAELTRIRLAQFTVVEVPDDDLQVEAPPTLMVRIIARRAPDGRVEFGMRSPSGEDIFPRARYFPATGPSHDRFLHSSEIDFGDGFVGQIIARREGGDPNGRIEFGFRVAGYDDIFPSARYFPASGPDHNRWLRSSEIEINPPR